MRVVGFTEMHAKPLTPGINRPMMSFNEALEYPRAAVFPRSTPESAAVESNAVSKLWFAQCGAHVTCGAGGACRRRKVPVNVYLRT